MEGVCHSALRLQQCYAVAGPRCKASQAPLLIWPPPMIHDGKPFFCMCTILEWLCRFLTGQRASQRPLGRFTFMAVLRQAIVEAETALRQQACPDTDLGLSGSGYARKQGRRRRGASELAVQAVRISVPRGPGQEATMLLSALHKGSSVFLELCADSLSWLYEWVDQEAHAPKRRRAVEAIEESSSSSLRGVFYSRARGG